MGRIIALWGLVALTGCAPVASQKMPLAAPQLTEAPASASLLPAEVSLKPMSPSQAAARVY
jgi:hypothetical protein